MTVNDRVIYEQDSAVVTLTLNDPDARNALSQEMIDALAARCGQINRDLGVRCVILTGSGKSFCSGGNVKEMRDKSGAFASSGPASVRRDLQAGIQRVAPALQSIEVPTIAAVNGHALGAGLDLALMCDIRVASDQAVFAESFLKLGLVSADGGAWFLPRIVGLSRACELTFTADSVTAEEAHRIGLVSHLASPENLMDEARALAGRIADKAPNSLRLTKRLLRESMHLRLNESLELAASFQAIAQNTVDHQEAVQAFFAKRPPVFAGR
jgi:enoyl-CoA hydratase/carnithine racemase